MVVDGGVFVEGVGVPVLVFFLLVALSGWRWCDITAECVPIQRARETGWCASRGMLVGPQVLAKSQWPMLVHV